MEFSEFLMSGNNFKSEQEVRFLNPLVMAFVGDNIYSLYVKTKRVNLFSEKVNNLTKRTAELVNARAQQQALFRIMNLLTEAEMDIVKRARNANIHTRAKNFSIEEYRHATALEALIGYLYLTKNTNRLITLLNLIFSEEE